MPLAVAMILQRCQKKVKRMVSRTDQSTSQYCHQWQVSLVLAAKTLRPLGLNMPKQFLWFFVSRNLFMVRAATRVASSKYRLWMILMFPGKQGFLAMLMSSPPKRHKVEPDLLDVTRKKDIEISKGVTDIDRCWVKLLDSNHKGVLPVV